MARLEQLGTEGWELIAYTHTDRSAPSYPEDEPWAQYVGMMKRPLPD